MNNKMIITNKDIDFYKKDNGDTNVELLIKGETLWVSQKTMAEIFDVDRTVITKHLKNIFNDGELNKKRVCAKFAHTANDGKISHKQAIEKANNEYEKFRIKQDEQYISSMDKMYEKYFIENK